MKSRARARSSARKSSQLTTFALTDASTFLSDGHWNQCHRVVAEDVDDLRCDGVATGLVVHVSSARQLKVAFLARPETLPLVLEDISAGPAILVFGRREIQ